MTHNRLNLQVFKTCLLVIIFIYASNASTSQNPVSDSLKTKRSSVADSAMIDYTKRLAQIEALHIADSLKRIELENELNSIRSTDAFSKHQLLEQLNALTTRDSLRYISKKNRIDSLRAVATGEPVMGFFNDTLFLIYQGFGSFTVNERAKTIADRIHKLAGEFYFATDSIKIFSAETSTNLICGESIIMVVNENDAIWNGTNKETLAESYKQVISEAVLRYKSETSMMEWLKKIGLTLVFFLIIFLIVKYTIRLFNRLLLFIESQEGKRLKGLNIRNYTLFDARRQVNMVKVAAKIAKWFTVVFLVYISLPFLFSIFPWTEGLTSKLLGYIFDPFMGIILAIWHYLPNLVTILVVCLVFRLILKAISFFKREIERGKLTVPGFYPDWADPTFQILRVLIIAFAIVVIFPYLPGSDSPVFQGVSVFLGFLFTFGSAGSLSNIMAGVILTYMRVYRIGDRVKLGEVTGDVIEKSLLVTRIRTIKNEIISIPNSTVMNNHTINYSSDAPEKGLIIHTTVTIGYDVPWKNMHAALIEAAKRTAFIEKEPSPFVLQTGLEDFYVAYQINAYTKSPNKQANIYSNLHQNIQDVCNENGIEILSPHYRAGRDGNMTTIPSDYLDNENTPPAFGLGEQAGSKSTK